MAIYRILHITFLLLLTASLGFGQQVEKTLVKSFNLQGYHVVFLDLPGPVEVKPWNNDVMRIQMSVTLKNGSEAMLKSLVETGRYNLRSTVDQHGFRVFSPGLEKEIMVRGKHMEESVSFIVFAPQDVQVKMTNDASVQTDAVDLPQL